MCVFTTIRYSCRREADRSRPVLGSGGAAASSVGHDLVLARLAPRTQKTYHRDFPNIPLNHPTKPPKLQGNVWVGDRGHGRGGQGQYGSIIQATRMIALGPRARGVMREPN